MSEDTALLPGAEPAPAGGRQGLTPKLVRTIGDALEEQRSDEVRTLAKPLHPADLADLLERLTEDEREQLIAVLRDDFDPEVLAWLDEEVRDQLIASLGTERVAAAIGELETDDAVYLLEALDEAKQREVLGSLPAEERVFIEQGLEFPEESAGRLMQRELVSVPPHWTVGQTIDFMRAQSELPEDFYVIFVVDPKHKPVGVIQLSRLLRTKRPVRVTEIMEPTFTAVPASMDQEEVALLFRRYALVSAPVVNDTGRLVGVITVDDVVDVIDEEAEEDLLSLAGVGETDIHTPVFGTLARRVRWLAVTVVNTLIASTVISQFESTIERVVALAVLMPIVAAMGGNAGMQVVTVVVRALATKDLGAGNLGRTVVKELAVGSLNGIVFAALLGSVAALWFRDWHIGAVLAAAMLFNMIWAGLAGTLIPLALDRMKVDPAIAAGPFLTTTTDVFGFFSFLGLATWWLL